MHVRQGGSHHVEDPRGDPPNRVRTSAQVFEGYEKSNFPKRVDKPLPMLRKEDREVSKRPGFSPGMHDQAIAQFLGVHGYTPEGDKREAKLPFSKQEIRKRRLKMLGALTGVGLTILGTKKLKRVLQARARTRNVSHLTDAEVEKLREIMGRPGLIKKGTQLPLSLSTPFNPDPTSLGQRLNRGNPELEFAILDALNEVKRSPRIVKGYRPQQQLKLFSRKSQKTK